MEKDGGIMRNFNILIAVLIFTVVGFNSTGAEEDIVEQNVPHNLKNQKLLTSLAAIGSVSVSGTQTIADNGECSFNEYHITGSVTGNTNDGNGLDEVSCSVWDDGEKKDEKSAFIPVGTTQNIDIKLSFEGVFGTSAPGVGIQCTELGVNEDPFYPQEVTGTCPSEEDDFLTMVIPAIQAAANRLKFDRSKVKHRNLADTSSVFKNINKLKTVIVNGSTTFKPQNYIDPNTIKKWNKGLIEFKIYLLDSGSFSYLGKIDKNSQSLAISISGVGEFKAFRVDLHYKNNAQVVDSLLVTGIPLSTINTFNTWYNSEVNDKGWLLELPNLYSSVSTTSSSPVDPEPSSCAPQKWKKAEFTNSHFHPNCKTEIRSEKTAGGHGHQACYGEDGNVILNGASAGTADRKHPLLICIPHIEVCHLNTDVNPFIWAAQIDGNPVKRTGSTLTHPMLYENGSYMNRYFQVRPPVANSKPELVPNTAGQCAW
jgi:hypothetical protein